jgi:UDP:flavonoid glycosyltransferase YjiC (YdhE family)
VVHSGGIGTTALALRAACPQLIIPLAHDQFDNAARICRLQLGAALSRRRMTPQRMERELGKLLEDPTIAKRVILCANQIKKEDGVAMACDAFERIRSEVSKSHPPGPRPS